VEFVEASCESGGGKDGVKGVAGSEQQIEIPTTSCAAPTGFHGKKIKLRLQRPILTILLSEIYEQRRESRNGSPQTRLRSPSKSVKLCHSKLSVHSTSVNSLPQTPAQGETSDEKNGIRVVSR